MKADTKEENYESRESSRMDSRRFARFVVFYDKRPAANLMALGGNLPEQSLTSYRAGRGGGFVRVYHGHRTPLPRHAAGRARMNFLSINKLLPAPKRRRGARRYSVPMQVQFGSRDDPACPTSAFRWVRRTVQRCGSRLAVVQSGKDNTRSPHPTSFAQPTRSCFRRGLYALALPHAAPTTSFFFFSASRFFLDFFP